MKRALACDFVLPHSEATDMVKEFFSVPDNNVVSHVLRHHGYILENVDSNGIIEYDFYPHHVWSNPLLYREFRRLDKRRIVAYRYVMEAKCLSFDGKKMNQNVIRRSEHVIEL